MYIVICTTHHELALHLRLNPLRIAGFVSRHTGLATPLLPRGPACQAEFVSRNPSMEG